MEVPGPWVETRNESQVQARVGSHGGKGRGREGKGKLKLAEDEEKGQDDRRKAVTR